MKEVKYGDETIFIDDSELTDEETGIYIDDDDTSIEDIEREYEEVLNDKGLFEDTITDLWGEEDER